MKWLFVWTKTDIHDGSVSFKGLDENPSVSGVLFYTVKLFSRLC